MRALEDGRREGRTYNPNIVMAETRVGKWSTEVREQVEAHNSSARPADGACDKVQVRIHENVQGRCTEVLGEMLGERYRGEHRQATEVARIASKEDMALYCIDFSDIKQAGDTTQWSCRKSVHCGTTRVLLVARGTSDMAHCIGLVADNKMRMEEWDALLKHRQPKSDYRFVDDHARNCARSHPSRVPEESERRSCLCCGISYTPLTCENTTAIPGACFTVYCNRCWEVDREGCKERSRRIIGWQQYNTRLHNDDDASSTSCPTLNNGGLRLQLTLFSRDDDRALLVGGCGEEAEEGTAGQCSPTETCSQEPTRKQAAPEMGSEGEWFLVTPPQGYAQVRCMVTGVLLEPRRLEPGEAESLISGRHCHSGVASTGEDNIRIPLQGLKYSIPVTTQHHSIPEAQDGSQGESDSCQAEGDDIVSNDSRYDQILKEFNIARETKEECGFDTVFCDQSRERGA